MLVYISKNNKHPNESNHDYAFEHDERCMNKPFKILFSNCVGLA